LELKKLKSTIFDENITYPGERNITESLIDLPIGSYTIVLTTPGNQYTEFLKIVRCAELKFTLSNAEVKYYRKTKKKK
jgi:hypothetical protein